MEVANILDIDGSQWEIQDIEARNRIAVIEDFITTKVLPSPEITKDPSSNWTSFELYNHYSFGKIHFIYVRLQNVSNGYIGSSSSAQIANINIKPVKETSFMLFDYVNGKCMRCYLEESGDFVIGESNGVSSGNNVCFGELIFAEA